MITKRIVTFFLLISCLIIFGYNASNGQSTSINSATENKYRNVGKLFVENEEFALYSSAMYQDQNCLYNKDSTNARFVLVLKKYDADYRVTAESESNSGFNRKVINPNYKNIIDNTVIPVAKSQCQSVSSIQVSNYFAGIKILGYVLEKDMYKEFRTNDILPNNGQELSILTSVTIDYGKYYYEADDLNSLGAIREQRKIIADRYQKELDTKIALEQKRKNELPKRIESDRAKASKILALYKSGAKDYKFDDYSQQSALQNIYSGNFDPFTGEYDSDALERMKTDYPKMMLFGNLDEMNELVRETKKIARLRLPIIIAFFAYHRAFEQQCYPKDQELNWIKETRRTDRVTKSGIIETNRIEGESFVFYVREPFVDAFDKTYNGAQEGNLAQLVTGTDINTRAEFQNDFVKFLALQGCSSPTTRKFEINLYLAAEWLLPLQQLLPSAILDQKEPEAAVTKQTETQKNKPTVKKPVVKPRRKP